MTITPFLSKCFKHVDKCTDFGSASFTLIMPQTVVRLFTQLIEIGGNDTLII